MDIQARNEAIGFCKKYIDEHGGGGGETSNEIATIVNKLGAKNLLINVGTDGRNGGVGFTKNADDTVTATRIESSNNTAIWSVVNSANLNTDHYANLGEVILSGTPTDGSANLCVMLRQSSDTGHIYYNGVEVVDLDGTGALVDLDHCTLDAEGTTPIGRDDMKIIVRIAKTENPDGVVFKPMLRYKDIEDGTYVPYAKTNKEATNDIVELQDLLRLTKPVNIGNIPTWFSFTVAGFITKKYSNGYNTSIYPDDETGVITEQASISANELKAQYTLDVANPTPDTDYDVNYCVYFEPKENCLLVNNGEYLKITVEKPAPSAGVSNESFVVGLEWYGAVQTWFWTNSEPTGTFTIGLKVPKGLVFTGLLVSFYDRHTNLSANYSKSVYAKITGVKNVNETEYNACDYKA